MPDGIRDIAVVILAAGQGTRMKSRRAKVLHDLCGRSILEHVVMGLIHKARQGDVKCAALLFDRLDGAVVRQVEKMKEQHRQARPSPRMPPT